MMSKELKALIEEIRRLGDKDMYNGVNIQIANKLEKLLTPPKKPYVDDGSIYVCPKCFTPIKLNSGEGEVMFTLKSNDSYRIAGHHVLTREQYNIIYNYILTTQQHKRELEELRGKVKYLFALRDRNPSGKEILNVINELKQLVGEDDE